MLAEGSWFESRQSWQFFLIFVFTFLKITVKPFLQLLLLVKVLKNQALEAINNNEKKAFPDRIWTNDL